MVQIKYYYCAHNLSQTILVNTRPQQTRFGNLEKWQVNW